MVELEAGRPLNIRFPGQYYDAETETAGPGTGLHYNRFRYYDPSIGRYISADPIGQVGGINTYFYVGNHPTAFSDPLGLIPPGWASQNLHGPGSSGDSDAALQAALDCFAANFGFAFGATNDALFGTNAGKAFRAGTTAALGTAAAAAEASGGFTAVEGATALGLKAVGGLPGVSAGSIAAATAKGVGLNALATAAAFEAGVTVGSAIDAAIQTALDNCNNPNPDCGDGEKGEDGGQP